AILTSGILDPQPRSRPSENIAGTSTGRGEALYGSQDHDSIQAQRITTAGGLSSIGSRASDDRFAPPTPIAIGTSPPNFQSGQRAKEAAFAAEHLDPEWRDQKFLDLSASLAVMAKEVESAQIDCRSSICRVELVARKP